MLNYIIVSLVLAVVSGLSIAMAYNGWKELKKHQHHKSSTSS